MARHGDEPIRPWTADIAVGRRKAAGDLVVHPSFMPRETLAHCRGGTIAGVRRYQGMPQKSDAAVRARAEAMFKRRQEQQADAPKAMAEYRAAERARYERMRQLRAQRLAREARVRNAG